ncbi:MAG: YihY/virulence factor BrkB family protein [Clostridia bacterium]|nr:YihY/virulence factor BrkB family protein [Clostridia bacterium]
MNICDKFKKIYDCIRFFYSECKTFHISAYSAKVSYFFILSFVPLTALINKFLASLFFDINYNFSHLISFGTLLSAWSAGKGFNAMSEGFNIILNITKSKNYFIKRIRGLILSIVFALIIVFLIISGLFGLRIISALFNINEYKVLFSVLQKVFFYFFVYGLVVFGYSYLPDWKHKDCFIVKPSVKHVCIASLLTSFVICVLFFLFSLYISNEIKDITYTSLFYFSLTVIIWIYLSVYVIMIGFKIVNDLNKHH